MNNNKYTWLCTTVSNSMYVCWYVLYLFGPQEGVLTFIAFLCSKVCLLAGPLLCSCIFYCTASFLVRCNTVVLLQMFTIPIEYFLNYMYNFRLYCAVTFLGHKWSNKNLSQTKHHKMKLDSLQVSYKHFNIIKLELLRLRILQFET